MSLIPFLMNDILGDVRRPASLFDQHFGMGLLSDDLLTPTITAPLRVGYYRPWRSTVAQQSGVSNVNYNKEGLKVNLDVQQFKPEELTVKVVDNFIVVEGKHEEKQDEHGFISRHFQRRYRLPEDVDPEKVASELSSDGVLSIAVPKKALPEGSSERVVPITQTQAPAIQQSKQDEQNKGS